MFAQCRERRRFQILYLEFDIEEDTPAVARQDVLEAREMRQLVGLCTRNRDALDFRFVTDESAAVPGQADIELKTIAAVFDGEVEGGKSIFRNGARYTCSPMAQK